MIRWFGKILSLVFMLLFLAACSTTRKAVVSPADVEKMEFVAHSPSATVNGDCFSGNIKFTAVVDGNTMTTRGTLKIKADEGIQIGVTALGLVELACLEFLPDNARLIYKLGKVYADVPYGNVAFLQESGIDYKMLEAVLLNRLFAPDAAGVAPALDKMQYAEEGDCIVAQTAKINGIVYKFFVEKSTGNLVRSEGTHDSGGRVVCKYGDFIASEERPFPRTIELSLEGGETEVTLQFVFLRLNTASFNFAPRAISPSYDKTDIIELIKSLEKH